MIKLRFSTAVVLALVSLTHLAFSQQPEENPKELEILGQYVGDWTSEVTSKPAVWTPEDREFRTSNHAEFVLDGRFLQHIEVNHVVGDRYIRFTNTGQIEESTIHRRFIV